MQLLLDANLSRKLVERLNKLYENCFHVDHIGLLVPATDIQIWNYALENDLVIVTNDDDFLNLSNDKGFPPKVILLRVGNQSTKAIEELLVAKFNELEAFDDLDQQGCLEIV
ncbi:MAG: DUF5615 family PIN-like protein [Chitinophagaceae bacterium]|nr:DUF5615 family PIN-like protein [Chitinophagaceae bacterium]